MNISGNAGFDTVDGGTGSDTLNLDWSANSSGNYLAFSVQKADASWVHFGNHWVQNSYNASDATAASIDNLLAVFAASPVQYRYSLTRPVGTDYAGEKSSVTWKNLETINVTGTANADLMAYQSDNSRYQAAAGVDTFFADLSGWNEVVSWTNGKNATNAGLSDEVENTLGATHQVKVSGMERLLLLTGSADDVITQNVTGTNDEFRLGAGNDTATTGDGNDYVDAGIGNDTINAGAGNDTLTGGAGQDLFIYSANGNGVDRITDFTAGDAIRVTGANLSGSVTPGTGGGLVQNQVQANELAGITTLYIGTDGAAGADIAIELQGSFDISKFILSGSNITLAASVANTAPTGTASAVLPNGTEDTPYLVSAASLLVGFTDADGDTLAVANLAANHASVSDNGNGTWTLTSAADYNGPVALNYDVVDGHSGSLAATQGFSLQAVNDPAVVGSADVTVQETNAALSVNGVLSISDVDSPAIFVAQPATGGKYGVFALGSDGTWSYKANLAYDYLNVGDALKDTFQVKASDGTATSVSVTIAGTADTTTVHLGDAPANQSGTGGQWPQAWSQTGYTLQHKADHTNGAEAWSAVKLSGVSSQVLTGGDIYAGDLGVSGQSAATSTVKQEIDGKEALRVTLPTAADSVTLKLASLFTHDDGGALSESGLLRLLDVAGHVVTETAFYADSTTGAKTVTLSAPASFTSLELIAGAYNNAGTFVYGGYSTAAGGFGGAVSTDLAGKAHGSDFQVDSMDFVVTLVGVA